MPATLILVTNGESVAPGNFLKTVAVRLFRRARRTGLRDRFGGVEGIFQLLAGFELGRPAGRDGNRLTGLGIPACPRLARWNRKGSKAGDINPLALLERVDDIVEHYINCPFRFTLAHTQLVGQAIN